MRADEIMTSDVTAVLPDTPVLEIARILLDRGFSGVPVTTTDGQLLGVITDADLIVREANVHFPGYLQILDSFIMFGDRHKYDEEVRRALGTTAEQIMTREVEAVAPETDLGEVARLMFEKRLDLVPVVDSHASVLGVITRSDIIRQMLLEMELGTPTASGADSPVEPKTD